jgi:hypothetical protein
VEGEGGGEVGKTFEGSHGKYPSCR